MVFLGFMRLVSGLSWVWGGLKLWDFRACRGNMGKGVYIEDEGRGRRGRVWVIWVGSWRRVTNLWASRQPKIAKISAKINARPRI